MKKFLTLLALVVFCLPSLVSANAGFLNLNDVKGSDADYKALAFLNQHDVIYGYYDATFKPDNTVTRAELLKIILEAQGIDTSSYQNQHLFSDVPSSNSLAKYVNYAAKQGYVGGYADKTFKPNNTVTRAEAAKIFLNTFDMGSKNFVTDFLKQYPLGKCYPKEDGSGSSWCYQEFDDVPGDNSLAPYIYVLTHFNYFTVEGKNFGINNTLKRREAGRIIYRMIYMKRQPVTARIYPGKGSEPQSLDSDWLSVQVTYPVGFLKASAPPSWNIKKWQGEGKAFTLSPKADQSYEITIYWNNFEPDESSIEDVVARLNTGKEKLKSYKLFKLPNEIPVLEFGSTVLFAHPQNGYIQITFNKALDNNPYFSVFYRIIQYFVYDNLIAEFQV